MKKNIIYIFGLFENQENPLFKYLKNNIEDKEIEFQGIELYLKEQFSFNTFFEAMELVQKMIDARQPEIIIAHSLGAYVAMQMKIPDNCQIVFLDPALSITDIILNNLKQDNKLYFYDDGESKIELLPEFVESIKTMPTIEMSAKKITSRDVCIFAAGKGAYKIANQYHKYISDAKYFFLPDANHEFSNEKDRQQIFETIKMRLSSNF